MKGLSDRPKVERDAVDFVLSCFDNESRFRCLWGNEATIKHVKNGLICLSFMDLGKDKEIEILYDPKIISKLWAGDQPHTRSRNYGLSQMYNALVQSDLEME